MTKTRVHDLAAEFGIESERLIRLLGEVEIHVRSHLSSLDAGQVAIVRARWERDKRKQAEPDTPKKTTRRRARTKTAEPVPEEEPARPRRRRRTAAEMAAKVAVEEEEQRVRDAAAAAEAEPPTLAVEPKPSLEERAAKLFRDLPEAETTAETPTAPEPEVTDAEAEPAEVVPEPAAEAAPARLPRRHRRRRRRPGPPAQDSRDGETAPHPTPGCRRPPDQAGGFGGATARRLGGSG